ncbi:MAG: HAMP domain-containing histidine kinase, partial [Gammaproteobacteria bacterium]|nr:HAMP domain-containing histidine kinase [Gammaproteobacteria bacterium]
DMLTQRLLLQRLEEELKLRTAMQDELVRAKEEAEAANRAKSEFLSVMSHELRTPLTSVQGALALLLGNMPDELPARAVKMLDIAQRNGERLMRLINDLLDISKIEAGKMEIQPAKHPLQGLLQQAVEANRAYADSMEIKQRLFMPEQTVYAMVDEDKFQQVMANLISNAIKFSPKINTIEIHLATHDNHARITVKDYGSGIPEAFRPMIFDKFTQHDAADTRKQGGTGLGLAITRHLVESMQGRIDFSSTTGMGSEFYVELPIPE